MRPLLSARPTLTLLPLCILLFPHPGAAQGADSALSHLGQIAFIDNRGGTAQVYLMNADGSGVRKLTSLAGDPGFLGLEWSPDGTHLMLLPVVNWYEPHFPDNGMDRFSADCAAS